MNPQRVLPKPQVLHQKRTLSSLTVSYKCLGFFFPYG